MTLALFFFEVEIEAEERRRGVGRVRVGGTGERGGGSLGFVWRGIGVKSGREEGREGMR